MAEAWSDLELVIGCLEGQKGAWNLFVARFARLIHWSIRKMLEKTPLADKADVHDEVFQEVFEKILRRNELSKLRNAESIRKFLSVTACHLAADKLKYFSRKEARDLPFDAHTPDAGDVLPFMANYGQFDPKNPAEEAAMKERGAVIASVIKNLSVKEQACLEFCCLDGKTHDETGRILGLSQDTVSTIIRRTKEKLKKEFQNRSIDDY